jgi:hypothetical protein
MKILMISIFCALGFTGFSQTHKDTVNMLAGKWIVNDGWKFNPDFNLKEGFVEYELSPDYSAKVTYWHKSPLFKKWDFTNSVLKVHEDYAIPVGVATSGDIYEHLVWVDKNRFYSKGTPDKSGSIHYFYFTRKQ